MLLLNATSPSPSCNVLVVNRELNCLKTNRLSLLGIEIYFCSQFSDAASLQQNVQFDLAVIERELVDGDGLALMNVLRSKSPSTSVIIVANEEEAADKLHCLRNGAIDYLTRSASEAEILTRVHVQIRRILEQRRSLPANPILRIGDLSIDLDAGKAFVKEHELSLTQIEFKLLKYLAKNQGSVVSRQELLREVWGYKRSGYLHILNSHMNRLRSKLKTTSTSEVCITTMRSKGYAVEILPS